MQIISRSVSARKLAVGAVDGHLVADLEVLVDVGRADAVGHQRISSSIVAWLEGSDDME
jgi:hypothetical protein